jgi:hypothetical protein
VIERLFHLSARGTTAAPGVRGALAIPLTYSLMYVAAAAFAADFLLVQ